MNVKKSFSNFEVISITLHQLIRVLTVRQRSLIKKIINTLLSWMILGFTKDSIEFEVKLLSWGGHDWTSTFSLGQKQFITLEVRGKRLLYARRTSSHSVPLKLRKFLVLKLCNASVSSPWAYEILSSSSNEPESLSAFLCIGVSIFLLFRLCQAFLINFNIIFD